MDDKKLIDTATSIANNAWNEKTFSKKELIQLVNKKDGALQEERFEKTHCISLISRIFESWIETDLTMSQIHFRNVVMCDTGSALGTINFTIHDSEVKWFSHLQKRKTRSQYKSPQDVLQIMSLISFGESEKTDKESMLSSKDTQSETIDKPKDENNESSSSSKENGN